MSRFRVRSVRDDAGNVHGARIRMLAECGEAAHLMQLHDNATARADVSGAGAKMARQPYGLTLLKPAASAEQPLKDFNVLGE